MRTTVIAVAFALVASACSGENSQYSGADVNSMNGAQDPWLAALTASSSAGAETGIVPAPPAAAGAGVAGASPLDSDPTGVQNAASESGLASEEQPEAGVVEVAGASAVVDDTAAAMAGASAGEIVMPVEPDTAGAGMDDAAAEEASAAPPAGNPPAAGQQGGGQQGGFQFGGQQQQPVDLTADPNNDAACPAEIPPVGTSCGAILNCNYGEETCTCQNIINGGSYECTGNQPAGDVPVDDAPVDETPVDMQPEVALYDTARAALETNCSGGSCHDNPRAGFGLTMTEEQLQNVATQIAESIRAGRMPQGKGISDADKQAIYDWADSL